MRGRNTGEERKKKRWITEKIHGIIERRINGISMMKTAKAIRRMKRITKAKNTFCKVLES